MAIVFIIFFGVGSYNKDGAGNFWLGIDLSGLYEFDHGYFITETLLMSIVAVIKVLIHEGTAFTKKKLVTINNFYLDAIC